MVARPISPTHISPSEILSFRHILVDALHEFLRAEHLDFPHAANGLAEVLEALSKYREEGTPLYPAFFVCADLPAMLHKLGATDYHPIGSGSVSPRTMRRALKQCAPLCRGGWSIYLVRQHDRLDFGVFLTSEFVLHLTAIARLRELSDSSVPMVGLVQLAENVLELRGSSGGRRLIYLSGAVADSLPAITLLWSLAGVITRHVPPELIEPAKNLLQRVCVDAMRESHGMLIAVLPRGLAPRDVFSDLVVLERPLDLPALIRAHLSTHDEPTQIALQGAARLLEGMLGVDGIVVFSSDGKVVGYNAFLSFAGTESPTVGGARTRTYEALAAMVGQKLVGAFVRSQDGAANCCTAHPKSPLMA